jgi:2-polyprenyl-3-methyl-5-hydroxy-6-metoxy-1,4-benzoquinol methylase
MAWHNPDPASRPAASPGRGSTSARIKPSHDPTRGETMTVSDELQARAFFERRYGISPKPLLGEIERRVIGGDWGANGYTTMAQADQVSGGLGLSATDRLLDLGTGRGWPGLYLAVRSGSRVVLADLPLEGLQVAAARARAERLADRAAMVVAAASGLPFHHGSFDAIIHTDVLC